MAGNGGRVVDDDAGDPRAWSFSRSGWATAVVLVLVLLTFGVLWHAHQRAKFHQLTAPVIPETTPVPMPGGQEAIQMSRVAILNDAEPEFVSATVLPGIGMQLLQATVAVPDQPQENLFASIPLSDAARLPPESVANAEFHLRVSAQHLQDKASKDDVIGPLPASDTQNLTLVDGGRATGKFQSAAAKLDVSAQVEVTLSGRQIDLIARATNDAEQSRFVSFEWCPAFLAPEGDRDRMALAVPSRGGTGGSGSVAPADFSAADGHPIGNQSFDLRFTRLTREFLSDGTSVSLRNGDRYTLRILGMGDAFRSVRARNDPATHQIVLGLSSMDPAADPDQHDQTLRPGQTLQWHLRMGILPAKPAPAPDTTR